MSGDRNVVARVAMFGEISIMEILSLVDHAAKANNQFQANAFKCCCYWFVIKQVQAPPSISNYFFAAPPNQHNEQTATQLQQK